MDEKRYLDQAQYERVWPKLGKAAIEEARWK